MLSRMGLLAFVALALIACQTVPKPVTIAKPQVVEKRVFVPITAALTQPCPVAEPRNRSGKELLRVATARKESLIRCANADKASIANIQGTAVDPPKPSPAP